MENTMLRHRFDFSHFPKDAVSPYFDLLFVTLFRTC